MEVLADASEKKWVPKKRRKKSSPKKEVKKSLYQAGRVGHEPLSAKPLLMLDVGGLVDPLPAELRGDTGRGPAVGVDVPAGGQQVVDEA